MERPVALRDLEGAHEDAVRPADLVDRGPGGDDEAAAAADRAGPVTLPRRALVGRGRAGHQGARHRPRVVGQLTQPGGWDLQVRGGEQQRPGAAFEAGGQVAQTRSGGHAEGRFLRRLFVSAL
jgi:hypothetical protein